MTNEQIHAMILQFLDARGGYVASAPERELFLMGEETTALPQAPRASPPWSQREDLHSP